MCRQQLNTEGCLTWYVTRKMPVKTKMRYHRTTPNVLARVWCPRRTAAGKASCRDGSTRQPDGSWHNRYALTVGPRSHCLACSQRGWKLISTHKLRAECGFIYNWQNQAARKTSAAVGEWISKQRCGQTMEPYLVLKRMSDEATKDRGNVKASC